MRLGDIALHPGLTCRTRDGVTLVSDLYTPSGNGPWPTLLMRQPYGRDIASTVVYAHPAYFARHGFAVCIQDVRGRGDSEGEFYPFRHEARDGADTIAWLRQHPACNGRIGMYGFSYQGLTQFLAAAEQPDGLQCLAPAMTVADLHSGWFHTGGCLRLASAIGWGVQMLKADARRLRLREASDALETAWSNLQPNIVRTPFGDNILFRQSALPSYLADWLDHPQPGDYWAALDISRQLHRINLPALHISGWYDLYAQGSVDAFDLLRAYAAPEARPNQYLLAGPWTHLPWSRKAGSSDLGSESLLDTDALHLRWFNHWLRDTGEWDGQPVIRHFVLGTNVWQCAEHWSPANPSDPSHPLTRVFYLRSEGNSNSHKGDGRLDPLPPDRDEPCDLLVADPEVPVPSPSGFQYLQGAFDQTALHGGNNVLIYQTAPLTEELHLFGRPRLLLHAACTAPGGADFVAKLCRVPAQSAGPVLQLCLGASRSSEQFKNPDPSRPDDPAPDTYRPDDILRWDILLDTISAKLLPGESLRLEIAPHAFPLLDRHPGSSVPSAQATSWDWLRCTRTVWHTPAHPTRLLLPIISDEK